MTPNPLKVFLAGSCVSRDTAELRSEFWQRTEYIARQSLISAANLPVPLPEVSGLSSPFQNRAVEGDFASTLFPSLEISGKEADRIVIDLVDERLGVYPYADGGYLTFSNELNKSKLMLKIKGRGRFIEFGTDHHFELWVDALGKLITLLREQDLLSKTRVIRAPFVDSTKEGTSVQLTRGLTHAYWNQRYERYYSQIAAYGIRLVEIPELSLFSSEAHRWGPAQYHYVNSAYEAIADQIEAP
ncbi:DUF6270 domain-containing protein [Paeniglutamicibacter psychrophenolicus]|uniref:DUF6270 domain-containing protein n=1 Tax=Paeniglutamicibacter psychrophenolicus TaxID=257454 RepID=UPI0027863006|nr:DUF6270 domain-containing protein [Paeniglutamicibacter psychrophenolicus]MDQ0095936.1 hypothetical protein [Paeniglutamicibacter psychrophenolicus]